MGSTSLNMAGVVLTFCIPEVAEPVGKQQIGLPTGQESKAPASTVLKSWSLTIDLQASTDEMQAGNDEPAVAPIELVVHLLRVDAFSRPLGLEALELLDQPAEDALRLADERLGLAHRLGPRRGV